MNKFINETIERLDLTEDSRVKWYDLTDEDDESIYLDDEDDYTFERDGENEF